MPLNFKVPCGSTAHTCASAISNTTADTVKLDATEAIPTVIPESSNDDQLYEYMVVTRDARSFSWRGIPEHELQLAETFVEQITASAPEPVSMSTQDLELVIHLCSLVLHFELQLPEQVADSVSDYWKETDIKKEDLKQVESFFSKLHQSWT